MNQISDNRPGLAVFLDEVISPILKEHGFRRKKSTWNRTRGDLVDVVDVQTSRQDPAGSCNFTVNVGIFFKPVYEICWGKPAPQFIQETDCTSRTRVSSLRQRALAGRDRTDDWWQLRSDSADESLNRDVREAMKGSVLPFLDRIQSATDLLGLLLEDKTATSAQPLNRISLAILKALLGDERAAYEMLRTVAATAPAWGTRIEEVISRIELASAGRL